MKIGNLKHILDAYSDDTEISVMIVHNSDVENITVREQCEILAVKEIGKTCQLVIASSDLLN